MTYSTRSIEAFGLPFSKRGKLFTLSVGHGDGVETSKIMIGDWQWRYTKIHTTIKGLQGKLSQNSFLIHLHHC